MPEVKNCRKCRKIFMYASGPQLCENCKQSEEEDFEKVRTFLRDFPGASIQEVARETEISTQLIYKFLKDGRLEVSESSPIALQCENCGARVKSGRFCINCSKKLADDMISVGRKLMESQKDETKDAANDRGLRYIHGNRKD